MKERINLFPLLFFAFIMAVFLHLHTLVVYAGPDMGGGGGGGGGGPGMGGGDTCEPVQTGKWVGSVHYGDASYDYGPIEYQSCSLLPDSGTVYERYINSSDFSGIQNTKQPRFIRYELLQQWIDEEYTCAPSGGYWTSDVSWKSRGYSSWELDGYVFSTTTAGTSISVTNSGNYVSGTTTGTATGSMHGVPCSPATKNAYWVWKVTVNANPNDVLEDEARATITCKKTYGNGYSPNCTPASTKIADNAQVTTYRWSYQDAYTGVRGTDNENVWNFKDIEYTNTVSDVTVDAVNGMSSDPTIKCWRIYHNDAKRDCTSLMTDNKNFNGWSAGDGTRVRKASYQYSTSNTPLVRRETIRNYHYVTQVEFSGATEAYVDRGAKSVSSVTCKKTFANGVVRNCIDVTMTDKTTHNVQSLITGTTPQNINYSEPGGGYPVTANYTHTPNKNGFSAGDGVRNSYFYFRENQKSDNWTLKYIYVIKVVLHDGQVDPVHVEETHNKASYLGDYQGGPFKKPECTKTFADNTTKDCTSFMSENKNYNGWSLGEPIREQRYHYIENTHDDDWIVYFYYVTNVRITLSDNYTYQDEPYGSYSCKKTYGASGLVKDCLNRMYIANDTGQNMNLGGQRKITYHYINNGYNNPKTETRVYAHRNDITEPAMSGKSGFRGFYYAMLTWQDGIKEDVSGYPNVWESKVCSTGEVVKYLDSTWSYTDAKGEVHGTTYVNEFYIPDTVAKRYCISATYPKDTYNNGLVPGWSYAGDQYAPAIDNTTFDLIGISKVELLDNTVKVHEIDTNAAGSRLTTSFSEITGSPFSGSKSTPASGYSPILAFNNKSYQTGHWYDFRTKLTWSDGSTEYLEDTSKFKEATWRYRDGAGQWSYDYSNDYPVAGTNGYFPYNSNDHRMLLEGWNGLRFDLFSEGSVRRPSAQTVNYQREYTVVHAWARSADSIVIAGKSVIPKKDDTYDYKAYLNWKDGVGINQTGTIVGNDKNPWGHNERREVTNSIWTIWDKEEQKLTTPVSGPLKVSFPEITGDRLFRTLYVSWGDTDRLPALPNFKYWDYFASNLQVWLNGAAGPIPGDGILDNCRDIKVPKMNCPLPINDGGSNYRLPKHEAVQVNREVEFDLRLRVEGVSSGSGE